VRLRRGDTVLLCTDGLWGVLPDERLASAFGPAGVMRVVPELIGLALHEGGPESDNCTAVAMTWAGEESIDMIPPSEGPVSTLMIPEGAVSSTIQMRFPGDDVPDTEFTEDRIDEAVAEIQRAIQRSSKLISR
jgi:protein phosphatase